MEKIYKGLDFFWLAVIAASTVYAIWMCVANGWRENYMNFFIPVIATLWLTTRVLLRKKMERSK